MSLRLNEYLNDLRNTANRLARTDINGLEDDSFWGKHGTRIICTIISSGFVYVVDGGFSDTLISYASTVLSILIGLFITAIIFSFDKFYKQTDHNTANSKEKLWDTQSYNYAKQFAYITGYNIVLCVFSIAMLSLSTLLPTQLSFKLHDYCFSLINIDIPSIILFCKLALTVLQRFLVFYWILRVMYNTLFVVSSMVKFMMVKIDREK